MSTRIISPRVEQDAACCRGECRRRKHLGKVIDEQSAVPLGDACKFGFQVSSKWMSLGRNGASGVSTRSLHHQETPCPVMQIMAGPAKGVRFVAD